MISKTKDHKFDRKFFTWLHVADFVMILVLVFGLCRSAGGY